MNVIISGWPGSGSSTLALVIANLLRYNYIYAGGVLKGLAQDAVGNISGPEFEEFERSIIKYFDKVWDPYVKWKAENQDNMVLDSKLAGFFVERDHAYRVMLIADEEERKRRAIKDGRKEASGTIDFRDEEVRKHWERVYGINLYDLEELGKVYDLILDNSDMSVSDEVTSVFASLGLGIDDELLQELLNGLDTEGKAYLKDRLKSEGLIQDSSELLDEAKQSLPSEIKTLLQEVNKFKEAHIKIR